MIKLRHCAKFRGDWSFITLPRMSWFLHYLIWRPSAVMDF